MSRLFNRVLFEAGRLGWAGALGGGLGGGLIVAALLAHQFITRPLAKERDALEARYQAVAASGRTAGSVQQAAAATPVAASPGPEEGVRRLFDAARRAGLRLEQGDYSLRNVPGNDALRRYQINLPVRGSYPALRAFLARALNETPSLALTSVDMRRDVIEEAEVEATFRFMLVLGERE